MWGIFVVIVLGLVQGASEFLPISSSGHLVVLYNIFDIKGDTILLSIILHIATLLAVLVCYRKQIFELIKKPFCTTNRKLIVATIPTVIIALLLKNVVENSFGGDFVIYGFLTTAIILIISQNIESGRNIDKNSEFLSKTNNIQYNNITNIGVGYGQAVLIGVAQGLAIFPGISRSGSTIATGLLSGVNKNNAADFSFLLSIPVILGGLVFELKDIVKYGADLSFNLGELFVGFVVAFISGLLAITVMLRLVKNKKLTGFSIYLFLLVLFLMLNKFVLGWF